MGNFAQQLGQDGQQGRGDDDAGGVAHAAEDDHDDDVHGAQEVEAFGVNELFEMRVKPARDAGEKRGEDEGEHFVFRGVDTHRLGSDFVVAHGEKAAAVGGADEVQHDVNRDRGKGEGPKEVRVQFHPTEPALRAERLGVLDHAFDDLVETERHDREVVAL